DKWIALASHGSPRPPPCSSPDLASRVPRRRTNRPAARHGALRGQGAATDYQQNHWRTRPQACVSLNLATWKWTDSNPLGRNDQSVLPGSTLPMANTGWQRILAISTFWYLCYGSTLPNCQVFSLSEMKKCAEWENSGRGYFEATGS